MCHTFNVISSLRAPQEATKWSAVVWWESFAVTDLKKKEWRVSWKCEKIARDRVWESWSAGSVSFPRSASVLNFEVKILSAEILNCIDQVVALNTFGTSTFKVSYSTKKCCFQSTKDDVCISSGWPCIWIHLCTQNMGKRIHYIILLQIVSVPST